MTRLTVDATLLEMLATLTEPVELCDAAGNVLGQYFPKVPPAEHALEPQISREEIERRKKAHEATYSTSEVLARLGKP